MKGSVRHRLYLEDRDILQSYYDLNPPSIEEGKWDYKCKVCAFEASSRDEIEKHALEKSHGFSTEPRVILAASKIQIKDPETGVAFPDDFDFCFLYHPFIACQGILDDRFFDSFEGTGGSINTTVINWAKDRFRLHIFYPPRATFDKEPLGEILCFPDVLAWAAISKCALDSSTQQERKEAYACVDSFGGDGVFRSKYDYVLNFKKTINYF